jgi:betaine lipid synthase
MDAFVPVSEFFQSVYLVDLSPSLCNVAKKRFERLRWDNVKVVCKDARSFKIEDYELFEDVSAVYSSYDGPNSGKSNGVELITMSYALSMIPDFYSVVDSLSMLLLPSGIIGATDFYVQSVVDYQNRNYTGGVIDRHCMWLSRVFWRSWFEVDRVNLDSSRRVSFLPS